MAEACTPIIQGIAVVLATTSEYGSWSVNIYCMYIYSRQQRSLDCFIADMYVVIPICYSEAMFSQENLKIRHSEIASLVLLGPNMP